VVLARQATCARPHDRSGDETHRQKNALNILKSAMKPNSNRPIRPQSKPVAATPSPELVKRGDF
jgi:hypothetical protein